jgi:alpha-galactosidase
MGVKKFAIYLSFFFVLLIGCNAYKPLNKTEDALLAPPLMGWASWNNYRVNINEEIIKSQADAMVKLNLTEYGYNHINIDDGFFGGRDASGKLSHIKKGFPTA